jgi:hypothetical protein
MRRAFNELTDESGFFANRWLDRSTSVYASRFGSMDKEGKSAAAVWYRAVQQAGMDAHAEAEAKPVLVAYARMREAGVPTAEAVGKVEEMVRTLQPPSSSLDETRAYRASRDNFGLWAVMPFLGPKSALANWGLREARAFKSAQNATERGSAARRLAYFALANAMNAAVAVAVGEGLYAVGHGIKRTWDKETQRKHAAAILATETGGDAASGIMPGSGIPVGLCVDYLKGYRDMAPDIMTSTTRELYSAVPPMIRAIQQHRYDDKALKAAGEFADALTTLAGVPGVETAITDYKLAAGAAGHPVGAK